MGTTVMVFYDVVGLGSGGGESDQQLLRRHRRGGQNLGFDIIMAAKPLKLRK